MALLSLSQVHVGTQTTADDGGTSRAMGQGVYTPAGQDTGVTAKLSACSVIQTVYHCQASDQLLSAVCLDTATRTIYTAQPFDPSPVIGIIAAKNSETTAIVVAYGPVQGFADLSAGQRYFLTHDGRITAPPLSPTDAVYIHPVGFALTGDTLFVMPQWPKLKRVADA